MAKQLMLGIAGATTLVGAATYYITPARSSDPEVPPIEAKMAPDAVMAQLETLSYKSFLLQVGETKWRDEYLQNSVRKVSPTQIEYDFSFVRAPVMRVVVKLTPGSDGETVVDVAPEIISDDLAKSHDLHPYDFVAMRSLADVLATEYIGSVLERRRMANGDELKGELIRHVGFSEDQWRAFSDRVKLAFDESFRDKVRKASWSSEWNADASYGYSERSRPSTRGYNPSPDVNPDAAVYAAEAAQRAAEAAARAASDR